MFRRLFQLFYVCSRGCRKIPVVVRKIDFLVFFKRSSRSELKKFNKPIFFYLSDFVQERFLIDLGYVKLTGHENYYINESSIVHVGTVLSLLNNRRNIKRSGIQSILFPISSRCLLKFDEISESLSSVLNQVKLKLSFSFVCLFESAPSGSQAIFLDINDLKKIEAVIEGEFFSMLEKSSDKKSIFIYVDTVQKYMRFLRRLTDYLATCLLPVSRLKKMDLLLLSQNDFASSKKVWSEYFGFARLGVKKKNWVKFLGSGLIALCVLFFIIFFQGESQRLNHALTLMEDYSYASPHEKSEISSVVFNLYESLWPGDLKSSLRIGLINLLYYQETKPLFRRLNQSKNIFSNQFLSYKLINDIHNQSLDGFDKYIIKLESLENKNAAFKAFYVNNFFQVGGIYNLKLGVLPNVDINQAISVMLYNTLNKKLYYSPYGYHDLASRFFEILSSYYFPNNNKADKASLLNIYFNQYIDYWLGVFKDQSKHLSVENAKKIFSLNLKDVRSSRYVSLHKFFSVFNLKLYQKDLLNFKRCYQSQDEYRNPKAAYLRLVNNKNVCFDVFEKKIHALIPSGLNESVYSALLSLLKKPELIYWRRLCSSAKSFLETLWEDSIYKSYHADIKNYYPFDVEGPSLTLKVFKNFFEPNGGLYGQFYKVYSKLKSHQSIWRALNIPKKTISEIEFGHEITRYFFSGNILNFDFSLAMEPNPLLESVEFRLGKQVLVYENGPMMWYKFHWRGQSDVCLNMIYAYTSRNVSNCKRGAWAVFRMFGGARFEKKSFKFSGSNLLIKYRDASGVFPRILLSDWILPRKLFSDS